MIVLLYMLFLSTSLIWKFCLLIMIYHHIQRHFSYIVMGHSFPESKILIFYIQRNIRSWFADSGARTHDHLIMTSTHFQLCQSRLLIHNFALPFIGWLVGIPVSVSGSSIGHSVKDTSLMFFRTILAKFLNLKIFKGTNKLSRWGGLE